MSFELHHGDCLEIMPRLVERFDGIFTDVPYGTTACKWDTIIPLEPMWEQVKRLLKPNGAFITTTSQPFTSVLVMSNLEWFKYEWCWNKKLAGNIFLCDYQPLKIHENVLVFGGNTYNPQTIRRQEVRKYKDKYGGGEAFGKKGTGEKLHALTDRQPVSIIEISNAKRNGSHPTQKPVALYEYLIRTYSNPGDTILDFAMGSGTTGVAAIRTGRHFVGIEKEQKYFEIAQSRISSAQPALFVEDKSLLTPRETDPPSAPVRDGEEAK
jgi:DNA modification methylase